jgi:hypothetical protein
MAAEHAPRRRIRALELSKYHGYGMEAPLSMLKEHLWNSERVELFPNDRIAFLNIRFGELFHRCSEQEWIDFRSFLSTNRVPIEVIPWWKFWGRFWGR